MVVADDAVSFLFDPSVSLITFLLVLIDLHGQVGGLLLESVDLSLEEVDLV